MQNLSFDGDSNELLSITLPVKNIDPLAALELLDDGYGYQFFWEKPNEEFALSAGKSLLKITAEGKNRFREINNQIKSLSDHSSQYSAVSHSQAGIYFLGGFSFFEENESSEWNGFGSGSFTVPEWQISREGHFSMLTLNFQSFDFSRGSEFLETLKDKLSDIHEILELNNDERISAARQNGTGPAMPKKDTAYERWVTSVERAKELIREKEFKKIVLARETRLDLDEEPMPTHIVNQLRQKYQNCFTFLIRQENSKTFLGCSPERLVSFRKNYVLTEALAGSIKRGSTATEDAVLEKNLMQSSKNADEHNYVVTAIEQRLSSFVKQIEKGAKPVIKKLTNVQHLFTPITAWLKDGVEPLAILEQLHPTPAVGGYPWQEAAPYLKELENIDRGWYAGPVGWLNTNNGGEFAVAIRSGLLESKIARFYAGCGIVADSDADAEWRETNLKFTPMLSALQYD